MTNLNQFYWLAQNYLVVDVQVAPNLNEAPIMAGQYFNILVRVKNTAPLPTSGLGSIVFTYVKVNITGSAYARINRDFRGTPLNYDHILLNEDLWPGQTGTVSFTVVAVKNLRGQKAVLKKVAYVDVEAKSSYRSPRRIEVQLSLKNSIV